MLRTVFGHLTGRVHRCARCSGAFAMSAVAGCATVAAPPHAVDAPVNRMALVQAQKQAALPAEKQLKRKIAIGRFTNETNYGRTFLKDASGDPLGKQASDMLATRLVSSQHFLVFERPDLDKVRAEQELLKQGGLIGVDALVVGAVTEFGRSTTGAVGFLSSTKVQTARAKVEVRLVDVRTGLVFFSATGTGEAKSQAGEIAGYGGRANYDSTLNDRAIGAAVSDVITSLMQKLEERPWRTDLLKVDGNTAYISGGTRQGLKVGDILLVMRQGEKVVSAQSGFPIMLPAAEVGRLRVVSMFGDNETNEGSVCEVISGKAAMGSDYFVSQVKG